MVANYVKKPRQAAARGLSAHTELKATHKNSKWLWDIFPDFIIETYRVYNQCDFADSVYVMTSA